SNKIGIEAVNASASGNRIYGNALIGLVAASSSTLTDNQVYSNANLGVLGRDFNGRLSHNLIYDNPNDGVWLFSGSGAQISNNTIYQPTSGDAIQVGGSHPELFLSGFSVSNLTLQNNIFSVSEHFAIQVAADSEVGFASDYNLFHVAGSGQPIRWEERAFATREEWALETSFDTHSRAGDPLYRDIDGADGQLGYDAATGVDYGQDDDFGVLPNSPAVDAGNSATTFAAEPSPNGGRINLGYTGDRRQATTSALQSLQLLSPNGLEKLEVGQPATITWTSAGLSRQRSVALVNAGGTGADWWSENSYQAQGASPVSTPSFVDLSGVTNPAPQSVYQSSSQGGFTATTPLTYHLPVDDGQYTLRLHFVEYALAAGLRLIDIRLQGSTVATGIDINVAAGGLNRAMTRTFTVEATGGDGVRLELFTPTGGWGATLAAIELSAVSPLGVVAPTVDLQISINDGVTWSTIATNVPCDLYGHGSYSWVPSAESNGNSARIRVLANDGALPIDASDVSFLITNGGHDFYVNDTSTANDVFSTATGSNLASGKRENEPVASLQTLLTAYDLEPGDVIHVDAGTYRVYRNLRLMDDDSGLLIEGPQDAGAIALFDRGNHTLGSYLIELAGGDDITIERLALTGANVGVFAANTVHSDRVTIANNDIYGHSSSVGPAFGIYIDDGNADTQLRGNRVHNITGNLSSTTGIFAKARGAEITENEVFGNPFGINVQLVSSSLPADRIVVSDNVVHENVVIGLDAFGNVSVSNNTVFNHLGANSIGVRVRNASAIDNVVHHNTVGVFADASTATGNRAYANVRGITGRNASTISANRVYS
ncbi:MAG: right-handed parallel beta-helix repeat-containing protein, partial [Planctomycetales bacterium]|nr:right-handed parallel beta-helix repeat-containing protein [Planctomycetales bacterium]